MIFCRCTGRDRVPGFPASIERNRLWHDPVVEIFSNLITPRVCCAANAYDLANRRWYRLDVNSEVGDDDWLSSTVAKHIKEFYAANQTVPPWNTIKTTIEGSPVTFEISPDDCVDRPIRQSLLSSTSSRASTTSVGRQTVVRGRARIASSNVLNSTWTSELSQRRSVLVRPLLMLLGQAVTRMSVMR
jgi:hypothetical protein